MGKLSNYTLAGIEAQLYPGRAEFRRGKDKKKRKQRSLRDNIMGTTMAGRIARGVGAAGLLALGGGAVRYGGAAMRGINRGAGASGLSKGVRDSAMGGAREVGTAIRRDAAAVRSAVGSRATATKNWMSDRFKKQPK
jgi:hypothetical protein